jgi:hypothetical protein
VAPSLLVFRRLTGRDAGSRSGICVRAKDATYYSIIRGQTKFILKVDATGDYEQVMKLKTNAPASAVPPSRLVNGSGVAPFAAYEFRSGRLILGTMTEAGHFVPDADSKIMRFGDYKYGPKAIPIWNLPGRFMAKGEAEKRGAWLTEHMAENPVEYGKEKARLDAAVEPKKR